MKQRLLWFSTALFFFFSWSAMAQLANPPIVTVFTGSGTQFAATFDGSTFNTTGCGIATTVDGYPAWGPTDAIRRGDFDGDGRLDLASVNGGTIMIKTTTGSTNNCLQSLSPAFVSSQWGASSYTWAADFNGDGKADVASASAGDIHMKLSNPGDGFAGFTSETWSVVNSWAAPEWTFVGDFNGDGKADIASANGGSVYMKLSRVGGGFDSQTWPVANLWGGAGYARVGDFNGDGKDDIASPSAGSVYMKLSSGTGFTSQTWTVSNQWGGAGYTWVADFNGDGRDDFASADGGTMRMKISLGWGFSSQDWLVTNAWGGSGYTWVIDFNGDGLKDIVSASGTTLYVKKNLSSGFVSQVFTFGGSFAPADTTWALDHTP